MKRMLRILSTAMAALIFTAAFIAFAAEPVQIAALSNRATKRIQVALYADFSCGNSDNEDLIQSKRVTVDMEPDVFDLADLLSDWTGLDFTINDAFIEEDEAFIDWSEDSTLVAGLDDREQKEDFFFFDVESLNWFMMDSLYRTILANLDVSTVYYSVNDGEPLTWDKGEMTGLTELPVEQSYEGSAFFVSHAGNRGIWLEDEYDAYIYMAEELADLLELNFTINLDEIDELDGETAWIFTFGFLDEDDDLVEIQYFAVTESGVVYYLDRLASELSPVVYKEFEMQEYYADGDPEAECLVFYTDGSMELRDSYESDSYMEGEYANYGNFLIFNLYDEDGDMQTFTLFIEDDNSLMSEWGVGFYAEGNGVRSVELLDKDEAYEYLCDEMSDLMDIGFDLDYYDEQESDGEVFWVFDLVYIYGENEDDYDYVNEITVSESGVVYGPSLDSDDLEPISYPDVWPNGSYLLNGEPDAGSMTFHDGGTVTLVSGGDDAEELEGIYAVYGNLLYLVLEQDDVYDVGMCIIADEDTLLAGSELEFLREGGVKLESEDEAFDYLSGLLSDLIDAGFDITYEQDYEIDDEPCWVFTLIWTFEDDAYAEVDYYAVTENGAVYVLDFETDEFMLSNQGDYEIDGYYYYNGDPDDEELHFNMDGDLEYTPVDEGSIEGTFVVYGARVYLLLTDDDGEVMIAVLQIVDEDALLVDGENGFFREE